MAADDAVRRAQFHRALEIMEQLTQNKIAAKQFQDYTKKLKDIDAMPRPFKIACRCCCWFCRAKNLRAAAPADDFFNGGAQLYISNNIPAALEKRKAA